MAKDDPVATLMFFALLNPSEYFVVHNLPYCSTNPGVSYPGMHAK